MHKSCQNSHSSSINGKTARLGGLRGAGEKTTSTQQEETVPVKTLHTKIRQNRKQCAWEDAFQSGIKTNGARLVNYSEKLKPPHKLGLEHPEK